MGEFKRRIKEAENERDTHKHRVYSIDELGGFHEATDMFLEIVEEMKKQFPKPHQNYWNEKGHLVTYEESVTQWFERWFGGEE